MKKRELVQYLEGRLFLDCPSIELQPCVPSPERASLRGSGNITIGDRDSFYLKVYISESSPDQSFGLHLWESGKIIPEEFRYNLIAKSMNGTIWYADRVLPDRSTSPFGAMITANVYELKTHEKLESSETNAFCLYFNKQIKIPLNSVVKQEKTINSRIIEQKLEIAHTEFKAIGVNFQAERIDSYTVLSGASSNVEITDHLIDQVYNAFAFVTAYPRTWSVAVTSLNGVRTYKLRVVPVNDSKINLHPPLSLVTDPFDMSIWKMFERFLLFISQESQSCSDVVCGRLFSVRQAAEASYYLRALTLSVSIEAILVNLFGNRCSNDPDFVDGLKQIRSFVKETGIFSERFQMRVLGMIGAMQRPRAKDILWTLKSEGLVEEKMIDTYWTLRNKLAHGGARSDVEFQEFVNQTETVLVLFYQLIFLATGYTGRYTDYGTYDYPVKKFEATLE